MAFTTKVSKTSKLTFLLIPFYILTKYSAWFSSLLGVIPTLDSLFGFFSKDISAIIGWLILFTIGYNVEVTISQGLFGQFKRKQLIDLITALYGSVLGITLVMSLIGPNNPDMVLTSILYSNFVTIILVLSFLGVAFCLVFSRVLLVESAFKTMKGPAGYFWTLAARTGDWNVREEYRKDDAIPNKLIRKITLGAWAFAPGLIWFSITLSFAILFMIFSLSSVIFLFSVVLWSIWHLRTPGAEKSILTSLHETVTVSLGKGLFSHIIIIGGFLASLLFFFLLTVVALEKARPQMLFLVSPFAYLFYFWYRQGKRLPVFVKVWMEHKDIGKRILISSLPAGGYPVFIIICFLSLINPLIFSAYYPFFTFWWTSLVISGFALLTVMMSLGRGEKRATTKDIQRDNVLIIIAVLTQLLCSDLLFWLWLKEFSFTLSLVLGGLFVFVWFFEDWSRLIREKYKQKPVTELVLVYIILPLGLSPILLLRTRMLDLIYLTVNLFFGFAFYAELTRALSVPKAESGNQGELGH